MANSSRPTSVDVVTGKAKVEYFFDPLLLLPNEDASTTAAAFTPVKRTNSTNNVNEREVRDALLCGSKHLFMPCVIVKDLEQSNEGDNDDDDDGAVNANAALVKTADGVLHKIRVR